MTIHSPIGDPAHRFVLVYRNTEGTAQSLRTWTLEEALRRLEALNETDGGRTGSWTIHELTEESA